MTYVCHSDGVADAAKVGRPWQNDELGAIIADYFAMLTKDLARQPYVKAHHCRVLMAAIGRTHLAVEFKHQNISAALDELGLPWIPGYIPKRNYQQAIFPAIDRYLSAHPEILQFVPAAVIKTDGDVFVEPPLMQVPEDKVHPGLQRLVRKFDPIERDHRNRSLGKAGEAFVVDVEQRRLTDCGRPDLARKIRWVSQDDGDGAGYDVLSYAPQGAERLIEVKTTNGSARTPFFLSRNERQVAEERPHDWRIYRVHDFAKEARIFTLTPPLENSVTLAAETWRATFNSPAAST
jgi:hypothetical protein